MKKKRERDPVCRYSIEGLDRLRSAILQRAVTDFKIYVYKYNYYKKKKNKIKIADNINEMRQVVYFINSDWFKYLTNSKCQPKECIIGLLNLPGIKQDKVLHKKVTEGIINLC